MSYFPSEKLLKKTGAMSENLPFKVREKFGVGVISGQAIARTVPPKKLRGQSQRWDVLLGERVFPLSFNSNLMVQESISVFKNGGDALIEGQDYHIDYSNNALVLSQPTTQLDDDVEIRCQLDVTHEHIKNDVLLLPRQAAGYTLTDDQLKSLLPSIGDFLSVEKLLRFGNEQLELNPKGTFVVQNAFITEDGIVADGQVIGGQD